MDVISLPASWYIASPSAAIGEATSSLRLFGRTLLAFRDSQGRAVLLDRQRVYGVIERYGHVWTWHGSPEPMFPLPSLPELGPSDDHRAAHITQETRATPRQVLENAFDPWFGAFVHGTPVRSAEVSLRSAPEEAIAASPGFDRAAWIGSAVRIRTRKRDGALAKALGLENDGSSIAVDVDCWPSFAFARVHYNGALLLSTFSAFTPIAADRTVHHSIHLVKKTGSRVKDLATYLVLGKPGGARMVRRETRILDSLSPEGGRAFTAMDEARLAFRRFYETWTSAARQGARPESSAA